MGRLLLEEDERTDTRVVVISFEAWRRRFGSDVHIIGRSIGLGTDQYTVVGVMPERFRFPVNDHYWIPLSMQAAERERVDAVTLTIAARLADGATLESAQAELSGIGRRMSSLHVEMYRDLRPQILPYSRAFFGIDDPKIVWQTYLLRLFLSLLVVVVAVNVAILVYARTATRVGEIAVRTALGASRTRVVTQLFAEALALSIPAAALGLIIANIALTKLEQLARLEMVTKRFGELPFWVDVRVSPSVVSYTLLLAVLGAAVIGVVPALKATGSGVQTSLQQLSSRGATRMKLGRVWTALVITQVAVAVTVLPFTVYFTQEVLGIAPVPRYPTGQFLEGLLTMDKAVTPADIELLSAPIDFAIRVRAQPAMSFAPRLRRLAIAVDPVLQIDRLISADERSRQTRLFPRYIAIGTSALTPSVLLLSAAGIYAMMSFTVARRRREIGIRAALGANARRVLSSIFARASAQIGVGILVGLLGTIALERITGKGPVRDGNPIVLFVVAALMATIGLHAAIQPALRGLAIQPTEALREE